VVCWHPLASLMTGDEFHLEAGRICVLTTRHRHACLVVGRCRHRELVEGLSPPAPSWPGAESEGILRGRQIHSRIFAALEPFRVPVR
jgi:hypothetical protein